MPSSYSHSALKTFDQCPRKYKFQYIEKPDIVKFVSAHMALGQIIHLVLQRVHATARDLIPITEEQAVTFYHKSWEEYKYLPNLRISDSHYGVDDYIRMGEKMLRDYYATFQPFRDGTLLGAELKLSFRIPGSTYQCSARVDRLWKRDDGVIEIWDYKTGSRLPQVSDPTFRHQMGLYQLAVSAQYPQFDRVELVQYFLPLKEAVRYVMSADELDEVAEMIRNEIADVRDATKLDSFPVRESELCNWCEYFDLCPAKRHRVLLETEYEEEDGRSLAVKLSELAEQYIQTQRSKLETDSELQRLKEEIVAAAKAHELTNLDGSSGQVKVSIAQKLKFVTKTEDAEAFAELNELGRRLGLEEYFKIDAEAVMKELYARDRLDAAVKEQLERFIARKEEIRVTVAKKRSTAVPDDEG